MKGENERLRGLTEREEEDGLSLIILTVFKVNAEILCRKNRRLR